MNKYVIIKGHPVLFPKEITHAEVVSKRDTVESGGFFSVVFDKRRQKLRVICTGASISLDIHSRPEIDEQIISDFLNIDL